MADEDALEGLETVAPVNRRKGATTLNDVESDIPRMPAANQPSAIQKAESFASQKIHEGQQYINDQKARQQQQAAEDRGRRSAEAKEKITKYREEIAVQKEQAEVRLLEAQAEAYKKQNGDNKLAGIRNSLMNARNEARTMFGGTANRAISNQQNPLSQQQTAPPLMMQIMNPGGNRSGPGRQRQAPQSPLMRQLMPQPQAPHRHKAARRQGQVVIYMNGQQPKRKATAHHKAAPRQAPGQQLGGQLARDIFGKGRRR